MLNKADVIAALLTSLERQLEGARTLVDHAQQSATHEEARAEDKYDTRGLEMSYVAAGASDRIEVLRKALSQYHFWQPPPADPEAIRPGALVELRDGEATMTVFVAPYGEGDKVEVHGHVVHVVTLKAPLGRALLRRGEGDEVSVGVADHKREWFIEEVR